MSQYRFTNRDGREVMYGLDKPTGGYFWTEFYTDEELAKIGNDNNEAYDLASALTFTELVRFLSMNNAEDAPVEKLIFDFIHSPEPSPLQFNTAKLFGKDLDKQLDRVARDIDEYRK
jgi:hypothetical protein